MGKGDPYYQLNYRAATYTPEFIPDAYVLEGATSSSGPWTPLVTVGTNNNPFKSHMAEDITVHPVGNRVLVTLVVVGTRNDDGSVHRYRNIRLFSRQDSRWILECWYNYEITGL